MIFPRSRHRDPIRNGSSRSSSTCKPPLPINMTTELLSTAQRAWPLALGRQPGTGAGAWPFCPSSELGAATGVSSVSNLARDHGKKASRFKRLHRCLCTAPAHPAWPLGHTADSSQGRQHAEVQRYVPLLILGPVPRVCRTTTTMHGIPLSPPQTPHCLAN